ncbi:MAG: methyltransferase domain-containing protein [candidate division NC10 bacterium]|nr:methyltransferase domain-containing protein [candidate division NC10 bacterium]
MNLLYYRRMLADRVRLRAFHRAIRATVRPGDVVVEIGAGLGTYSFFAARAGARRVYAIEADPEVCRLAVSLAEQNGLADRVSFRRGYSTDIELPERADVAIFEDYTSFFFSSRIRGLLRDIRSRLLKRDGRLLPCAVDLYVAGGGEARVYRELGLGRTRPDRLFGLDFSETRRLGANLPVRVEAAARHLLTPPLRCVRLDLRRGEDFSFAFAGQARAGRDGLLRGVLGWMDLELAPGLRLSCSPLRPRTVWGQIFYPFADPLRVRAREPLKIGLELIFPSGVSRYLQRWTVSTGAEYREGNTFAGVPFSEQSLNGESASTKGKLGPRSRVLLTVLSELREETSYGNVAAALVKKHPRLFESRDDALAAVVRLAPAISNLAGDL